VEHDENKAPKLREEEGLKSFKKVPFLLALQSTKKTGWLDFSRLQNLWLQVAVCRRWGGGRFNP